MVYFSSKRFKNTLIRNLLRLQKQTDSNFNRNCENKMHSAIDISGYSQEFEKFVNVEESVDANSEHYAMVWNRFCILNEKFYIGV